MRYATGHDGFGGDSGLNADVTGADVLSGFVATAAHLDTVIASAPADVIQIPEHLKGLNVIGSLVSQNEDGTNVLNDTTYLIEDGRDDEEDILLKRILELDSYGTGRACKPIVILSGTRAMVVNYAVVSPDGEYSELR